MSQLNPRQQEAVRYTDGPLLVLAGAGSGKTSVITQKIAHLIRHHQMPANRIVAVTFTNKAAREMKERVGLLLQDENIRGLVVSTFHNLGLRIIRQERKKLGLKSGFSIFDDQDTASLIKELMLRDYGEAGDMIAQVQRQISQWKNALLLPDDAMAQARNSGEQLYAQVYAQYVRHLKAYNAVDFDDLITLPVLLFQNQPDVLERWQNRVRYLLVDEYQDTNTSQYQLVKQLVGIRARFCVVGDDDQSIYAWRGAQPENLALLQQDFPSLKVVKLEQNYRSTGCILKAANQVIGNNPHLFEKKLWSEHGFGDPIRVIRCRNEDHETDRITSDILNLKLQKRYPFKDFAVLYRGNHQSRMLELKMQSLGIPYKVSGGQSFFSRAEIKDIMAYLKVIINPEDDNALLRIINTPRREIGPATLEKLGEYATERNTSMLAVANDVVLKERLTTRSWQALQQFVDWLDNARRNIYSNHPIDGIRELIDDMDYEGWLFEQSSSSAQAEKRMENVWSFVGAIRSLYKKAEDDERHIEAVISKLVLMDILDQQQEEDDSDRVQLMTLHASKGLEFPHVYIMGVEEELLPHRNSIEADTIDEERRLMYVGITRARRTLTLTLCNQRKQFGEVLDCLPSRFLDELPQEDLVWEGEGAAEKSPEEKQAVGRAHIANLKNLLG